MIFVQYLGNINKYILDVQHRENYFKNIEINILIKSVEFSNVNFDPRCPYEIRKVTFIYENKLLLKISSLLKRSGKLHYTISAISINSIRCRINTYFSGIY